MKMKVAPAKDDNVEVESCRAMKMEGCKEESDLGQELDHGKKDLGFAKAFVVTENFEAASSRCKAKVKSIAALCRSQNRRYRDIDFDLDFDREKTIHSVDRYTYYAPSNSRRVFQIFQKPVFFANGVGPSSEVLGWGANDGEFLGALGTAATSGMLEKICVARDEDVGVYGFIFCVDNGWKEVIIDDLLFTCIPRWEELNRRTQAIWQDNPEKYWSQARTGGRSLFFARSMDDNETWVALLEKAYAKLCGDYATMYRKLAVQIVEHLTGSLSTTLALRDIIDPDELWKKKLLPIGHDHLAAVYIDSSPPGPVIYKSEKGLVDEEPFYITKALEISGRRFLLMRNPWGHKSNEWTGRWGTGSPEWTPEWLQRVIKGEFGSYQFGQEGRFIMEYCDFLEIWDYLASFQIFDDSWALTQLWLEVDLGGYPRAHDYGDVSYTIHIDEPTRMIISLQSQYVNDPTEGLAVPFLHRLDFVLFKRGESEPLYFSQKSDAPTHYGVAVDIDLLEAGDYVLHPRIDRQRRTLKPPPNPDNPTATQAPLPPAPPMPIPGPPISNMSRSPSPDPINGNSNKGPKPPVVGRKFTHVKSAMLVSHSVAANFDILHGETYARNMPLPAGTFTGEDLTTMEIRIFDRLIKQKEDKKAAWELASSRAKEKVEAGEEEVEENLVRGVEALDEIEGVGEKRERIEGSEVDLSTASTIVAPTPAATPGVEGMSNDVGSDGEFEVESFEDALENLDPPDSPLAQLDELAIPGALPSSPHSTYKHSRRSHRRASPKENPFPPILLPDFDIPTPPSSTPRSTPNPHYFRYSRSPSRSFSGSSRSISRTASPIKLGLPLSPASGVFPCPDALYGPSGFPMAIPPPIGHTSGGGHHRHHRKGRSGGSPSGHYLSGEAQPMGTMGMPPLPPLPPAPPPEFVHGRLRCQGCDGPIVGNRYKCMESVTCPFYDLCEGCYKINAHAKGHRFLEIPTTAESALLFGEDDMMPGNEAVLGLKVYTSRNAGTKIEGQLRHGILIRCGLRRNLTI